MIYADFNATTPLSSAAIQGMQKAMELWGNPSSAHRAGRRANEILNDARTAVADAVGASPSEIVFTSGGSEASTLALVGSFWAHAQKNSEPFRVVSTRVEHSSVRDTLLQLTRLGADVRYAPLVPGSGALLLTEFARLVDDFRPHLVSIMAANNETGVIFPIDEVANLCRERRVAFHTDAVQALGKMAPKFWHEAPLISVSAHKIFGPKGVGALVVRRGSPELVPTHFGGSQEIKRRGGTENMVGIAGFGAACQDLEETHWHHLADLQRRFEANLGALPSITIQGAGIARIPNTTNVRFEGVANEVLLSSLDLDNVCVSAGSACSSGSISPSHVLLELGMPPAAAKQCVRFSWGKTSTQTEVDTVSELVIKHVNRIRSRRDTRTSLPHSNPPDLAN